MKSRRQFFFNSSKFAIFIHCKIDEIERTVVVCCS